MARAIVYLAIVAAVVSLAFYLKDRPPPHPLISTQLWPHRDEYRHILEKAVGPRRFIGWVNDPYGGFDVYEADDGHWWLVGVRRKFTRCKPAELEAAATRLLQEEMARRIAVNKGLDFESSPEFQDAQGNAITP